MSLTVYQEVVIEFTDNRRSIVPMSLLDLLCCKVDPEFLPSQITTNTPFLSVHYSNYFIPLSSRVFSPFNSKYLMKDLFYEFDYLITTLRYVGLLQMGTLRFVLHVLFLFYHHMYDFDKLYYYNAIANCNITKITVPWSVYVLPFVGDMPDDGQKYFKKYCVGV